MVLESDQETFLRLEVLKCALDQAGQDNMSPAQLQQFRELVVAKVVEEYCRRFTGDPPAKATPMHAKWKLEEPAPKI